MPEKPENWNELTPEEKRRLRLDAWVRGDGIQFDSPEAEAKYKERATLFRDAVELKKPPARVPITGLGGGYVLRRVGLPQKATMYDQWEEAAKAMIQFQIDFEPDSASFLFLMSGPSMELLGQTNMKWAGHGLPDDIQYQFLEQEYMKADEYPLFLEDPSDFVLRRYMPRLHLALKGLQRLPKFSMDGIGFGGAHMPFIDPEVQEALDILKKAAELSLSPMKVTMDTMTRLHAMGFPGLARGFGAAPFDILGDSLRGTRGIMTDLYRQPDKVLAACEKVLALTPVPEVPMGSTPLIMMPLHKGSDGFMSSEQYEKFYWPTFKQVMLNMIDEGLIPTPFAEGVFNTRLEYITELPKGSTVWFFDRTDMHRAKDVLGDVCCIMGNVPITLIATGTPDQIKAHCKDLIDYCGKDGGYILSPGTQIDDGQEETIRTMVNFTKEYGVYR
jgi:uroporphyrinogen-III decarboxylase